MCVCWFDFRNIFEGLDYLHSSKIGYHGFLSTSRCLVDGNWMVKLSDFGIEWLLINWLAENRITEIPGSEFFSHDGLHLQIALQKRSNRVSVFYSVPVPS